MIATLYRIHVHDVTYGIEADPASRHAADFTHGRPYESAVLEHIYARRLPAGALAVDVGAGIGNHAVYLAAVCGLQVVAFEPKLTAVRRLDANRILNGLEDRILFWDVACGADNMHADWDPETPGRLIVGGDGCVPVRRLDSYKAYGAFEVALLKIDVEGAEADVLRGATTILERDRPIIYAEAKTKSARARIGAVLAPYGYELSDVIPVSSPVGCWEVA